MQKKKQRMYCTKLKAEVSELYMFKVNSFLWKVNTNLSTRSATESYENENILL